MLDKAKGLMQKLKMVKAAVETHIVSFRAHAESLCSNMGTTYSSSRHTSDTQLQKT